MGNERRFYQKVTIDSREEAFVILKAQYDANCGGYGEDVEEGYNYVEDAMMNCLIDGSNFENWWNDSDCFLCSSELNKVLVEWENKYNTIEELSSSEGFDSLDIDAVKDSLYKKVVGSSDLETLYKKDLEIFGDLVRWYKDEDQFLYELFKKYWDSEE